MFSELTDEIIDYCTLCTLRAEHLVWFGMINNNKIMRKAYCCAKYLIFQVNTNKNRSRKIRANKFNQL